MDQDIRWQQRLSNYHKALYQLQEAVELSHKRPLSNLEKQGTIQCFEYSHELAWKTLKDFLESHGVQDLLGSKDVVREAFHLGLLQEGDVWMEMIRSRNQTSHIYDEKVAEEIAQLVITVYFPRLQLLARLLEEKKE
ncbi:MAG: nucleotidyltransferase [Chlamydiae bacterium]|nr:nucleotidyltransferase [Chlamydiota bacterium]